MPVWERVVECVPNFSEGRRAETIARLVAAVESAGALVLDTHADADHNRSVVTFVAEPHVIVEAAVRVIAAARDHIDLRQHAGQHPRVGAADVVPFVPVRGVTMEECVALAHEAGERVWHELGVPVFFYEQAALRPERANLEDVRRKGFEQLRDEIATSHERAPDVGEARVHESAGAVVIGARRLLVAYNVNLRTDDVAVARRIARAVRGRDGGLRHLKALGFALGERGLAQVSMNLVNFERTQLHHVFEAVRREAERYGVGVAGSEIVGLVPRAAIERTAEYFLRVENFSPDLVLENRIEAALERRRKVEPQSEHMADLGAGADVSLAQSATTLAPSNVSVPAASSSATVVPARIEGGGEAAAYAAALGASLGEMVARLIEGQKRFQGEARKVHDCVQELRLLRARLADAAREDSESFKRVVAARHLPKADTEQERARARAIEAALKGATAVPLEVAGVAAQVAELVETLAEIGDARWLSDSATGAQLAHAGATAARYNVLVNCASIDDADFVAEARARADELLERARAVASRLEASLLDSIAGGAV